MIRLAGLHHVRFAVTDLARSEAFARDFGLMTVPGSWPALYMRGAGTDAYHYVAEAADRPGLRGVAFAVESAADLKAAAAHGASPVRELAGPGGGQAVTLRDPHGLPIDLVHGIQPRIADPLAQGRQYNFGPVKQRIGHEQRLAAKGPAQLMRLGHVGIYVKDYAACARWYQDVLGLLPSDHMYAGSPDHPVCGFYRLDRGDAYVDHHTVFLAQWGKSDLHHLSFEVQDFEAQFATHAWLLQRGHNPVWGVGRHPLGCHVFDVWMDPDGYRFETFTDTDQFNASYQAGNHDAAKAPIDTWHDGPPEKYFGEMPEEMKRQMAANAAKA